MVYDAFFSANGAARKIGHPSSIVWRNTRLRGIPLLLHQRCISSRSFGSILVAANVLRDCLVFMRDIVNNVVHVVKQKIVQRESICDNNVNHEPRGEEENLPDDSSKGD